MRTGSYITSGSPTSAQVKCRHRQVAADAPDDLPPVQPYPPLVRLAIYLGLIAGAGVAWVGLYHLILWFLTALFSAVFP